MPLKGFIFGALAAVLVLVVSVLLLAALGVEVDTATKSSFVLLVLLALVEELCRGIMLHKLFEKLPWSIPATLTFALGFFGLEAILKYQQLRAPAATLVELEFSHILLLSLVAHVVFTLCWYAFHRWSIKSVQHFFLIVVVIGLIHFAWNSALLQLGL